jgi:3-oxoacyl-[acyl-carrier protein] reductase
MKAGRKTVLLTGGAGAIGRGLVRDLSGDNQLIVLDRDEAALSELHHSCPEAVTYLCDLASSEDVAATVESIYSDRHKVDILINNAGTIHSEPLISPLKRPDPKHDPGAWHRTIENNLHSVFYVTSCIVERMAALRTRGVVVNVSSIAAAGNAGQSAYSAAKAAVNALTKTWSRELAPFGIRVAAVAPGFLDVASTRKALPEKCIDQWVRQTPAGRLGTPRELSLAVRFIIENDYFNGRILELDGGLTI